MWTREIPDSESSFFFLSESESDLSSFLSSSDDEELLVELLSLVLLLESLEAVLFAESDVLLAALSPLEVELLDELSPPEVVLLDAASPPDEVVFWPLSPLAVGVLVLLVDPELAPELSVDPDEVPLVAPSVLPEDPLSVEVAGAVPPDVVFVVPVDPPEVVPVDVEPSEVDVVGVASVDPLVGVAVVVVF